MDILLTKNILYPTSADVITRKLTDEDLNDIIDINFTCYYADGDNTCINTPDVIEGNFYLICYGKSTNNIVLIITDGITGITYTRTKYLGEWSGWNKVDTTPHKDRYKVEPHEIVVTCNNDTLYLYTCEGEDNEGLPTFNDEPEEYSVTPDEPTIIHVDVPNYGAFGLFAYNDTLIEVNDLSKLFMRYMGDNNLSQDFSYMFYGCNMLEYINFNINPPTITSTKCMFSGCESLTTIDLSYFNNKRGDIIDISGMFEECTNLTKINLSTFNTWNVTNMSYMFANCPLLETIEIDPDIFTTDNVTDMSYMFSNCKTILPNLYMFDTSNVENMAGMFEGYADVHLNLSNFNTSKVTDMSNMFAESKLLLTLNIGGFDTSNVTNMSWMFAECKSLTSLNLNNFNTSNVTDMSYMFSGCKTLLELIIRNFDISNVTNMTGMFEGCTALYRIRCTLAFKDRCENDKEHIFGTANTELFDKILWEIF